MEYNYKNIYHKYIVKFTIKMTINFMLIKNIIYNLILMSLVLSNHAPLGSFSAQTLLSVYLIFKAAESAKALKFI